MKSATLRYALILCLAISGPALVSGLWPASLGGPLGSAEAVVGAPATPVSYAGVARRSTVGAGAPGVGVAPVPGVAPVATAAVVAPVATAAAVTPGVGAPGVGVAPGVAPVATAAVVTAAVVTPGVGAPGVGVQPANRGGPVNRVGVR